MPFWIKERDNPQLGKYFVACGEMSVSEAKKRNGSLYGSNTMHEFESHDLYRKRLQELHDAGERVQP